MGAAINPVVQGLQYGMKLKQEREDRKIAQQKADQEGQYQQSLIDDAQAKLQEGHDQFQATHKLAEQAHNVQMLSAQQGINQSLLQTGYAPGFSTVGEDKDKGTVDYQASFDHPLMPGAKVTLPSPERYAQLQADRERITLAPKTEQKVTEEQAKNDAEAERQLKVDAAKLAAEHQNKLSEQAQHDSILTQIAKDKALNDLERTKITAGATMGAASLHSAATIKAAQIRTGADMFGAPDDGKVDPSPYIKALQTGQMTQEQLDNQFKGQPIAASYLKQTAYKVGGIVPITNAQQTSVGALQQLKALVPKMEELANTSTILSPIQAYERSKEIQAEVVKVAITIGGDKGQRLQKMLIDKAEGFIPGALTPKAQALQRIENFNRVVKDTFDDLFQSQSKEQKTALWGTVTGGNGSGGATQAQPAPSTVPLVPPPGGAPVASPGTPQSAPKKLVFIPGKGLVQQ